MKKFQSIQKTKKNDQTLFFFVFSSLTQNNFVDFQSTFVSQRCTANSTSIFRYIPRQILKYIVFLNKT